MINYNKNKLINRTLDEYYNTFSHTLDTAEYVPDSFNKKIYKYIYKNLKKTFRKIDKEDTIYQKQLQQQLKDKGRKVDRSIGKSKFNLLLFIKNLFSRNTKRSDD